MTKLDLKTETSRIKKKKLINFPTRGYARKNSTVHQPVKQKNDLLNLRSSNP